MDARVGKFVAQGVGAEMAEALVAAGFSTPRDIIEGDLEDLPDGYDEDTQVMVWVGRRLK